MQRKTIKKRPVAQYSAEVVIKSWRQSWWKSEAIL